VNVLTHLEKRRVETLIKEGKTFSESKTQSRNELLSVFSLSLSGSSSFEEFDISKNTEEGGILLAISVILQGDRSVGQLTELLSRIQNDFSDNGKLDDEKILYSLRISTFEIDMESVRKNVENRYKELNVSNPISDFESQIRKFLNPKDLKITITGEGTVEEKIVTNPSGREYPAKTIVELTPIAKEGWVFEGWSGDLSGSEVPKQITVDGVKNVTAKFKRKDYDLKITIEGEGTVEEKVIFDPNAKAYPFETVVELTPKPKDGWSFDGWTGDVVGRESPLTITIKKGTNITVKFSQPVFKILENGVTCVCEGVNPGNKGKINGIEYEAVDNDLLRKRRNEGADLTKLCTSLVTDMKELFGNKNFNQEIGNWDVSNVTTMESMFFGSSFNKPIKYWDVRNVTNMVFMFKESLFNQPIGDWNVSKVTNMEEMFKDSPFNQPIGDWNVSNLTNMTNMFQSTPFNQPIGKWDVSKVKYMSHTFDSSKFNQSIEDWNVSNVESIRYMFALSPFNQPIGKWNVSKVKDMQGTFYSSPFNHPIGDWDVSNVTNMFHMFFVTPNFNQPLENWNVSKVTDMFGMFSASIFNQPIGKWNVSNVSEMSYMFQGSKFNQTIEEWNVEKVSDMSYMFANSSFNLPIGKWKVSNVTTMRHMFSNSRFNQSIGTWNVKLVEDMTWMFNNSPFDQDISKWCVSKITTEPLNFSTQSPLKNDFKPKWGTCPN
jgi:uncharacterized repeat protein (TIGR02543 family)